MSQLLSHYTAFFIIMVTETSIVESCIESHPKAQPLTKIKGNRVKNKITQHRTAKCASPRRSSQIPKQCHPASQSAQPQGVDYTDRVELPNEC
jgi:hypothetical protein